MVYGVLLLVETCHWRVSSVLLVIIFVCLLCDVLMVLLYYSSLRFSSEALVMVFIRIPSGYVVADVGRDVVQFVLPPYYAFVETFLPCKFYMLLPCVFADCRFEMRYDARQPAAFACSCLLLCPRFVCLALLFVVNGVYYDNQVYVVGHDNV